MDSLTQAALGAAVGEAVTGRQGGRYTGAIAGAILGTVPDLDIIFLPFMDELERISVHRGLSHSIFFCVLLSFLLAGLMKNIRYTKEFQYTRLLLLNLLVLGTHIILDTFTPYGTQLFQPFYETRVSFDSIAIVDPVFTIPLLTGLFASLYFRSHSRRRMYNFAGLGISTAYLFYTLAIKGIVENHFQSELDRENIRYEKLLTVPVRPAVSRWYGVARTDSSIFMGRYNPYTGHRTRLTEFDINDDLLAPLDPKLVNRMKWFSKGFYTVASEGQTIRVYNMQCDMQGIRQYGKYRAPTAFYFEITPDGTGDYNLSTGMHHKNNGPES